MVYRVIGAMDESLAHVFVPTFKVFCGQAGRAQHQGREAGNRKLTHESIPDRLLDLIDRFHDLARACPAKSWLDPEAPSLDAGLAPGRGAAKSRPEILRSRR